MSGRFRRLALLILVAAIHAAGIAPAARAGPAGTTGITFDIVDEGTLSISWGAETPAFTVNGDAPSLTATSPPVKAAATFTLLIADTRADENRTGYAIAISASIFTAEGSPTPITPDRLHIDMLTASVDGIVNPAAIGATLDQPVTVVSTPPPAPAGDIAITLTVVMTLTPGIAPGAYSGSVTLSLLPPL